MQVFDNHQVISMLLFSHEHVLYVDDVVDNDDDIDKYQLMVENIPMNHQVQYIIYRNKNHW